MNSRAEIHLPQGGQHSLALEKIPHAARRMGISVSQFYRVAKRDGLRIIKVTIRGSAVPASDVDRWISSRLAESGVKAMTP